MYKQHLNLRHLVQRPALIIILMLTACSTWRGTFLHSVVRDPTLTVQQIIFTQMDLKNVHLTLQLEVHNPNRYGIDLIGFRYRIRLNDQVEYQGENRQRVHLAPGARSKLDMPIALSTGSAYALIDALDADGKLHYQVNAHLFVASLFTHNLDISTQQQGNLILPHLPKLGVDALKVKSLNLNTANLIMRLKLTNPNNFVMGINNIDYRLIVRGQRWISGRYGRHIKLPPRQSAYADIAVSVHLDRIRQGLVRLILKGDFHDYELQGSFTLDSPFPSLRNLAVPIHYRPQ